MKAENTEESNDVKKSRKKQIAIIFTCVFLVLIGIGALLYWRVAVYYQTHFFPNTTVNGFECDDMEASIVAQMLDREIQNYELEVTGRVNEQGESGVLGVISAKDIDLQYVGTFSALEQILEEQNTFAWIEVLLNKSYNHTMERTVTCDEDMLNAYVKGWDAFQDMKVPQDAYISDYSEEKGMYEIIPETIGTQLKVEMALNHIQEAVLACKKEIDLEELDCYEVAGLTADDKALNDNVNAVNRWLATKITYDWNGQEILVGKELVGGWISFDGMEPKLDEEAVALFVKETANEWDTYGKSRNFMTTLGVELTLPSGAYGWKTDIEKETRELIEAIYKGSVTQKEPVYISKGRWKGMNDIGNSYVEADLTNQHLYLYYQGALVLETDFVSGAPNQPGCLTPAGVFGLTYKTTNAVLRGADYETPVTYWMPFHGNFGMHDATWRTEFGGDIYLTNGSHGCLNLPLDKAGAIYGYLSEGFPIICYYY